MFAIVPREFVIFLQWVYWNVFLFWTDLANILAAFCRSAQMRRGQVVTLNPVCANNQRTLCTLSFAHPTVRFTMVTQVIDGFKLLLQTAGWFYSMSAVKPRTMLDCLFHKVCIWCWVVSFIKFSSDVGDWGWECVLAASGTNRAKRRSVFGLNQNWVFLVWYLSYIFGLLVVSKIFGGLQWRIRFDRLKRG